MTRTQTRTYGVVTPSLSQLLLTAMLRAFLWLVSNVVSIFGMFSRSSARDWHTRTTSEAQSELSNANQEGTTALFPPSVRSTGGVSLGPRSGRIDPVDQFERRTPKRQRRQGSLRLRSETEGAAAALCERTNQDARHKAEHDTFGVAAPRPAHILRDDRSAIPQDEASGRRKALEATPTALILRDRDFVAIVSKDACRAHP